MVTHARTGNVVSVLFMAGALGPRVPYVVGAQEMLNESRAGIPTCAR